MVNHTEEIPQQNEELEVDNFSFKILEVSNTKIELVELKIKPAD
ncbi:transporter associated domain-containing protein [uncultured Salegentibacter sp.]